MKARALTVPERELLIDAGLDPVYCQTPDGDLSEDIRQRRFERKMNQWIVQNIYKLDIATMSDHAVLELGRKTMRLTVLGEEAEIKNS